MHHETVIVTGASSGIGHATAEAFLDEDWTVYATARDPADVAALADRGCTTLALDVTDDDAVARVVDRVLDDHGHVDCLVNNAGYAQFGPIEDVPVDAVHDQFDVNVYGPHRLTRAVLPHMRRRREGTIVNVSSAAGRLSFPGGGAYCGSKFALEAMTDALRAEVDEYGVDAVLVEPGPVDTGFTDRAESQLDRLDRSGAYESFYAAFEDASAIGGGGPGAIQPERVADAVVNAASATQPDPRVPVGAFARLGTLGRFVPDRLRDRAFGLMDRLR